MGRFKCVPYILGAAAAILLAAHPVDAHAIPVTTAGSEISFGDLDIEGKIIYTTTEDVASPFYKKGISTAEGCVMIRKEPSVESEAVGKLYKDAGCEVIEETGEWILIQSGSCKGYVYAEYVVTGKEAEKLAKTTGAASSYGKAIADNVEIKSEASDEAETILAVGVDDIVDVIAVVPETEWTKVLINGVEGYVKTELLEVGVDYTVALSMEEDAERMAQLEDEKRDSEVQESIDGGTETSGDVIKETEAETKKTVTAEYEAPVHVKVSYSVEERWETVWATTTVNVRSDANTSADKVGSLSKGNSVTRIGVCSNGWSRVDFNGTTAYISSDYLTTEEPVYNTSTGSGIGQQIVDYARQFLGNPYVYGGTSLTNGADCSGFVQTIFSDFGYSLPRTCTTQSRAGRAVSVEDLQPGDIIIFAADGYEISHVAIYSGNGMTIHASNWDTGIIETSISYSGPIYCCRRIAE